MNAAFRLERWLSYSKQMGPLGWVDPHGVVGSRYGEHHRRFLGNQFVGVVQGSFDPRGCLLGQIHQNPRQTQLRVGGGKRPNRYPFPYHTRFALEPCLVQQLAPLGACCIRVREWNKQTSCS